jgi:amino acid transporter
VKFFPVLIVIVLGFLIFGTNHGTLPTPEPKPEGTNLFTDLTPLFGVIASVPAILFAFDGFYTVSSNTLEMKEPKKAPLAMVVGLLILSVIDVLITLGMLLGTQDGSVSSLTD